MKKIILLFLFSLVNSLGYSYDFGNAYGIHTDPSALIQCPNKGTPSWSLEGKANWCLLENGTYNWHCDYDSFTDCRNAQVESSGQGLKCCPTPTRNESTYPQFNWSQRRTVNRSWLSQCEDQETLRECKERLGIGR